MNYAVLHHLICSNNIDPLTVIIGFAFAEQEKPEEFKRTFFRETSQLVYTVQKEIFMHKNVPLKVINRAKSAPFMSLEPG